MNHDYRYQMCKPITTKDIGKNHVKAGRATYGDEAQTGPGQAAARRLKRMSPVPM